MDTANKLLYLQDTKSAIKDAIVAKGVSVPNGTTFRNYATKISEISGGEPPLPQADPYVRPTEWLTLPDNVTGVEKVSILKAVFDTDSEFTAFTCQGAYTVDWGDGVVEDFADNVKAEHQYDYSNVNLDSATVAKFGYKQCVITITPQTGQSLTKCLLNQFHTTIGSSTSYNMNSGFLDMNINLPNLAFSSYFGIGTATLTGTISYVNMSSLERVSIGQIGVTSLNYLFYNCYNIQEILFGFDTSVITSWGNTFYNCYSLQKSPTIVFNPSGVSVNSMYQNCYSLVEVQDIDVVLSGSITSIFSGCYSLTRLVLNITSNSDISFGGMFSSCYSLHDLTLTLSGTGKITNLLATFQNCYSLTEAPMLDTSLCTSFSSTFASSGIVVAPDYNYLSAITLASCYSSCKSLVYVPDITVSSNCTNLSSLLFRCSALPKAPNIIGSTNVTNVSQMLEDCTSMVLIPTYEFSAVATSGVTSLLRNCGSLKVIPAINIGTIFTSNTSTVLNNFALSRMLLPLKYTFSVANAKMSASALNEMYSILPTVTGQTVTVTGNYGVTAAASVSGTTGALSRTITGVANTSGITVGKFATGAGISTSNAATCTFTNSGDLVTNATHRLVDGNIVSFSTIVTTTGIVIKTIYYVVNATADTFQVSATLGGTALTLTTNGSGTYTTPAFVTNVVTNTSVTLSAPCVSSGTSSISYWNEEHKHYLATMKGWTVTL